MSTLPQPIPTDHLLTSLNWRYATKQFDPNKKIPEATWSALEQALVLSPSSFGLQPWKFLVITTPSIKEQLLAHSWGQKQVVDASHLVVFAAVKAVNEAYIDSFVARQAEVRSTTIESLAGYRNIMVNHLKSFSPEKLTAWASHQVYIALGNFMTSAALIGVDTCPMEGIIPAEYDKVLGLEAKGLATVVACPAGYRLETDKYAQQPKVRFPLNLLIERY